MTTCLDLQIDQGSDAACPICFLDDFSEVDLTGCTARMEVRASASSSKAVDLLTTENGRITIAGADLTLQWPHDVSEAIPAGTYVYDLELISAGGKVTRALAGRLTVSQEVTRWPYQATA